MMLDSVREPPPLSLEELHGGFAAGAAAHQPTKAGTMMASKSLGWWAAGMSLAVIGTGVVPATAAPTSLPQHVAGHLYRADGKVAGAGNRVELVAWPKNELLTKIAAGEQVPMLVVASGVTDAAGHFKLAYSPTQKLAAFAASEGLANFMLQSAAGGLFYSYHLSQSVSATAASRLAANSSDAMGSSGTDDVSLRPAAGFTPNVRLADMIQVKSSAISEVKTTAKAPCGLVKRGDLPPRWAQVGRASSTTSTSASMTYTKGSSSKLGAAVSKSGGGFSASGDTSVSSTASVGMTKVSGYATRGWQTKFVYSKFQAACAGSGFYGPVIVRATSYAGGAAHQKIPRPAAKYCVSQSKGSSFTKDQTRSSTIAGAVGTSSDIGFNLNAQTGWSSSASIRFSFTAKRKLCGISGYPAGSPGELRAKE